MRIARKDEIIIERGDQNVKMRLEWIEEIRMLK